ncbi:type II secretion system F family protein [Streptomyces albipurpureus]|uniref:Type II secretion system F family protein n=1 Tax=Streptomyces albipurpureus TaxID=2897419 RepID=A0ABT0URV4_9ACTN|nr:type II secretion system F family protein [Streptomyces sp. CWNU-1]MCM2391170.1 type II secretion system F family protein [Streptomyces sp. CWNU-1]
MSPLTSATATALCAGAMVWLVVGQDPRVTRARVLLAEGGVLDPPPRWSWARLWPQARGDLRRRREWLCLPVGLLLAVAGESVLPLLAAAVATPLVRRWSRAREMSRQQDLRADGVIAFCAAVAGELRAGLQPGQALLSVARSTGALGAAEASVTAAARFGGDVPAELRVAAQEPGAGGLAGVAACWRVAVEGGSGLAAGLDRLEAALRAERDQRADLRAHLAGVRATIGLLALLPLVGLAMGWALGADPLRVLLHSPAGLLCLLIGGVLEVAGVCWAGRIVRKGLPALPGDST